MDRLLARLERSFVGRLAIERLTTFIVGGMAIAFVLCQVRPELRDHLTFVRYLVPTQPWRVVSFLFVPPEHSLLLLLLALYWTWLVGTNLEQEWGALKFNVYYLLGALGTLAAGVATGAEIDNEFLNVSLGLAFATTFPEFEIRLFFILPVKMKWLGIVAGAYVVWQFIGGGIGTKAAIAAVFANYLLFFGGHLLALARGRSLRVRQTARRAEQRPAPREQETDARACAICGKKQDDGADIRVCSCEKCNGVARLLCLDHARNH